MSVASRSFVSVFARRVAPAAVSASLLALAPAAGAAAVDPDGGYTLPSTSGSPSSGSGTSSSGSGGSSSSGFPIVVVDAGAIVRSTDVCAGGTLDEATFEAEAQAAIDTKLASLGGTFFGISVAVTDAAVAFACDEVSDEGLAECEAEALDAYRTCIGWGDGTKPGPGSDFIGCWSAYQEVLDACAAANAAEVWRSSLVLDADMAVGAATGTFQVAASVAYARVGGKRQRCFYDAALTGFELDHLLADTVRSQLSEALRGDICW